MPSRSPLRVPRKWDGLWRHGCLPEGPTLLPLAGPTARAPNPEPREVFPGLFTDGACCRSAFRGRLNLGNSAWISFWDTRSLDFGLLSSYSPIQLTYHPPFSIRLSFLPSWFWLRDDFLPPDLSSLVGMSQFGMICPTALFASHWPSVPVLGFPICLLPSNWGVPLWLPSRMCLWAESAASVPGLPFTQPVQERKRGCAFFWV